MPHQRVFRGRLSDIDIASLREFIEIVEAGGITAAEGRLGKGKSAISLGLSRLESRLSMRLCERGRSGFRLTEQGQMVHSAAVELMAEIGRFSDFIGAAASRLEDEIAMFADDSFLFEFGEPLAREIAVPGSRGANTCYLIHRRARPLGLGGSILRSMILDEFAREAAG